MQEKEYSLIFWATNARIDYLTTQPRLTQNRGDSPPSTLACWGTTLIRGAVATIAESAHMMVNLIDGYMA
jgi:hypothetical protein